MTHHTIAALLVLTTACAATNDPTMAPASRLAASSAAARPSVHASTMRHTPESLTPAQREAIAQVKKATAKYERLAVAQNDGFTSQYPAGCAASSEGAQGVHYLNPARVDTLIELLRPELVMYEPQGNGRMALVGVDYVVPFSAWTHNEPPRLLGVPFMRNEKLGVWALHIWNFRENPSGTFAMWNPRVSCALATP